jgi:hypothetical protein
MHRKTAEEMDRGELIGMVHTLQSQVAELTSPERTRLYQLGRLHDQTTPAPEASKKPSLLQRIAPRLSPKTADKAGFDLSVLKSASR